MIKKGTKKAIKGRSPKKFNKKLDPKKAAKTEQTTKISRKSNTKHIKAPQRGHKKKTNKRA